MNKIGAVRISLGYETDKFSVCIASDIYIILTKADLDNEPAFIRKLVTELGSQLIGCALDEMYSNIKAYETV